MDSFSGDQCRNRWKSRLTISCDYTVAICNTQIRGVTHEDCAVQARWFIYIKRPSHSIENTIEVGYQVAKGWSMSFARSSLIVCSNWGCAWELMRSFVLWLLHDLPGMYNIQIVGVFSFKLSHEILCSYVWLFVVLMYACNWFYFHMWWSMVEEIMYYAWS